MNDIDMLKKEIGQRLKACRSAKNLTQEKLSEKIGLQTKSYSNIETGMRFFSIEILLKLMSELDVSADYILTGNMTGYTPINAILSDMSQENVIRAQTIIRLFSEAAKAEAEK